MVQSQIFGMKPGLEMHLFQSRLVGHCLKKLSKRLGAEKFVPTG